jgi:hypothetical protein
MCYSDSPGENLVNNLNLIVSDPSGKRYVGNQKTVARTSLKLDAKKQRRGCGGSEGQSWPMDD